MLIHRKTRKARGDRLGIARALRHILAAVVCSVITGSQAWADEPECVALLDSEPLRDLLVSGEAGNLATDRDGSVLLGATCDQESLQEYFFAAGWEFTGQSTGYITGGPPAARYEADTTFAFCEPRDPPWRWVFYRCGMSAGVKLFEGRITHINAGLNI